MIILVMITNLVNRKEKLKLYVEQNLIPQLKEKIDLLEKNNEIPRVEYNVADLIHILEIDIAMDSLYGSLKNFLLDTDIGISIKRIPNNSKFIFFKKSESVKRETDVFKELFEQKFKKILVGYLSKMNNMKISIPLFKDFVGYNNYENFNLYLKLKNMLKYSGEFDVSIAKNVIVGKEITDILEFYYQKKSVLTKDNLIVETPYRIHEKYDEDGEDFASYLKESEKEEIEKNKVRDEKLVDDGADFMKKYIIPNVEIYKCVKCKEGILKFPELICPNCNTKVLEKWE